MNSRLTSTLLTRTLILLNPEFITPRALIQFTQTLEGLRQRLAAESPSLAAFMRLQSENEYSVKVGTKKKPLPKPKWVKESIPGGEKYTQIKKKLRELMLHTVCEEAKCPNLRGSVGLVVRLGLPRLPS